MYTLILHNDIIEYKIVHFVVFIFPIRRSRLSTKLFYFLSFSIFRRSWSARNNMTTLTWTNTPIILTMWIRELIQRKYLLRKVNDDSKCIASSRRIGHAIFSQIVTVAIACLHHSYDVIKIKANYIRCILCQTMHWYYLYITS